MIRIPDRYKP